MYGPMPEPMKKIAIPSRKRPITCFTSSLAGPERGILLIHFGFAARMSYGSAIPTPIAPNVIIVSAGV